MGNITKSGGNNSGGYQDAVRTANANKTGGVIVGVTAIALAAIKVLESALNK